MAINVPELLNLVWNSLGIWCKWIWSQPRWKDIQWLAFNQIYSIWIRHFLRYFFSTFTSSLCATCVFRFSSDSFNLVTLVLSNRMNYILYLHIFWFFIWLFWSSPAHSTARCEREPSVRRESIYKCNNHNIGNKSISIRERRDGTWMNLKWALLVEKPYHKNYYVFYLIWHLWSIDLLMEVKLRRFHWSL